MVAREEGTGFVDGYRAAHPSGHRDDTCLESDGTTTTLDYGFFSDELGGAIRSAEVRSEVQASDHYPLVFELDMT